MLLYDEKGRCVVGQSNLHLEDWAIENLGFEVEPTHRSQFVPADEMLWYEMDMESFIDMKVTLSGQDLVPNESITDTVSNVPNDLVNLPQIETSNDVCDEEHRVYGRKLWFESRSSRVTRINRLELRRMADPFGRANRSHGPCGRSRSFRLARAK